MNNERSELRGKAPAASPMEGALSPSNCLATDVLNMKKAE
jgi:hypothetical protein